MKDEIEIRNYLKYKNHQVQGKSILHLLGLSTFIDLLPHINLIDNFHYARNIALPGKIDDFYDVDFGVNPPGQYELSFHKDWADNFSKVLFDKKRFSYEKISFFEIAKASRR